MTEERLSTLLNRTAEFINAVNAHVATLSPAANVRAKIAFQAGVLSLEHGTAAIALIEQSFVPSAFTLMRPQYECLVRGVWLIHAASDTWVGKLGEPLSVQSAKRANEGPMLAEMLKELEEAPDSPKGIVAQLKGFRDVAWKAMSSYNHGGIHPLSRVLTGYPPQLIHDAVCNSNAVLALATQLVSIATGDPTDMGPVRCIHAIYADCLPLLS